MGQLRYVLTDLALQVYVELPPIYKSSGACAEFLSLFQRLNLNQQKDEWPW